MDGELNEGDFREWTPIVYYSGTFDGAGYTISGIYYNDSNAWGVGLFGANYGTIRNVGLIDSYICGKNHVGGICGYVQYNGSVSNCYNAGNVTAIEIYVGGICGASYVETSDNIFTNCYNAGKVSGSGTVGGICGYKKNGANVNCYNVGKVSGRDSVGGICGNREHGKIENCYYLDTTAPASAYGTAKSETEFASGEVCWLLNGGENQVETPAFFQTLSEDELPVLDNTHNQVYKNTACDGYEPTTDSDGDGYYEIANAGQLYWFADKVNNDNEHYGNANAVLTGDITVNSGVFDEDGELNSDTSNFRAWTPIGTYKSYYANNPYSGIFDGAGYTISGLYFNNDRQSFVGLFGYVDTVGKIQDVTIADSYMYGKTYVGGICGGNVGTISNCYNTGDVSGSYDVGGVCGGNPGTITNCYYLKTEDLNADLGDINDKDMPGSAEAKTEEQFASGEVCWLLNGGETQAETPAFYQNIGTDAFPVFDSTHNTVYKNTACDEVSDYYNNENKDRVHSYENGICTFCGAFEDGMGARLAGASLSLDGSIGVNFYMQLADDVIADENAYLLFTLPNGVTSEIKVSDAEKANVGDMTYYVFKCNVAATEMTDAIKAQIKTSSGNGIEYSYSVKEYADYLLAHITENAEYAKAEELVRTMLNYGAYAQTFKKYNTDILPCVPSDVSEYVISEHGYTAYAGTKVEFAGANLSMLSNITLRLFFKADDITDVKFMNGAKELEIGKNNGLYFVEIANITPDELSNDFTVSISDDGLVTYSPMTYCYQVSQTSNDAAFVNLVKAIAQYNDAAEAYFKEAKV